MDSIRKLLRTAIQYHASDLYITTGSKPVLRINGELIIIDQHPVLDQSMAENYLMQVMDDSMKKKLEEASDLDFSINAEDIARFRVNVFMQRKGIGGVFRVIPERAYSIDELKLPQQLKTLTQKPRGLILVTGPTGCGKSTTLASMIKEINQNQRKHIITIEDPIEFIHENQHSIIEQREVGNHTVSFQRALRAALREDPDVILVGEMRDLETISLAITAAETGHLVLATLHTSGASKAIDRMIDVFPPTQQEQIRIQLAETLEAVIWQNLLLSEQNTVNGTKRIAALEIMLSNHAVRNLIRKGQTHQLNSVIETSRNEGMQTMNQALKELRENNIISEEIYHRNAPKEESNEMH